MVSVVNLSCVFLSNKQLPPKVRVFALHYIRRPRAYPSFPALVLRTQSNKIWPFVRRAIEDRNQLTIPIVNFIFDDTGLSQHDQTAIASDAFFVSGLPHPDNGDGNDEMVTHKMTTVSQGSARPFSDLPCIFAYTTWCLSPDAEGTTGTIKQRMFPEGKRELDSKRFSFQLLVVLLPTVLIPGSCSTTTNSSSPASCRSFIEMRNL